jgi:hypothetical protein
MIRDQISQKTISLHIASVTGSPHTSDAQGWIESSSKLLEGIDGEKRLTSTTESTGRNYAEPTWLTYRY